MTDSPFGRIGAEAALEGVLQPVTEHGLDLFAQQTTSRTTSRTTVGVFGFFHHGAFASRPRVPQHFKRRLQKKVQPRWTNGFTNGSKKVRFENEDDRVAPKTNKKKKRKERNYSKKHRVFHGAHRVFDESTSAMKA